MAVLIRLAGLRVLARTAVTAAALSITPAVFAQAPAQQVVKLWPN